MKREQVPDLAASLPVEALSQLSSTIFVEISAVMSWHVIFFYNCRKIG